ncbi:hypothetical protein MVEN_01764100 [Mycena venus]|uniref:Uncharacterized protein n=1 Tax=Mycena venus TaxID=2733690 RepID=A0A8H7CQ11_9AGAR|nr:hypothetical protein MVEN_01764100 [Mycena venus]
MPCIWPRSSSLVTGLRRFGPPWGLGALLFVGWGMSLEAKFRSLLFQARFHRCLPCAEGLSSRRMTISAHQMHQPMLRNRRHPPLFQANLLRMQPGRVLLLGKLGYGALRLLLARLCQLHRRRDRVYFAMKPSLAPPPSCLPPEEPVEGPSSWPPPPLSSDDLLNTSLIVGNKKEKKAKRYAKGVRKRRETQAATAAQAKTKEELMDDILGELIDNDLSFGDLMLYVFDPIYKQGQMRWHGFFRCTGLATKILNLWVSRENSETARAEVDAWAVDYVAERARAEAKEITKLKALQTGATVNGDYVDGFSMHKMHDFLHTHAKTAMKIFDAFATSTRNVTSSLPARIAKRALILTSTVLTLLGEYSYKNNFSRRIMALYLYASGAQHQTISVLNHLGISESYQNLVKKAHFLVNRRSHDVDLDDPRPATPSSTPMESDTPYVPPDPLALGEAISAIRSVRMGTLRQLSGSMRDMARAVAATGLYAASSVTPVPVYSVRF